MKLSIIVIGDELLLGRVSDTNSSLIARTFEPLGWEITGIRTVGDSAEAISDAVATAMGEADLVISTGGLGPTRDDITKNVLMELFGGHLVEDQAVLDNLMKVFRRRGLEMNALTRSQAMVPDTCRVIINRYGTAPLMHFCKGGKSYIAMPGVPFETRGMLADVLALAQELYGRHKVAKRYEITVYGITESSLAEHLATYEDSLPAGAHLAYLPSAGRVVLRLDTRGIDDDRYVGLCSRLRDAVGPWYVGEGMLTPAAMVLSALRSRSLTLCTAESCTGGGVARAVTSVAGCSDVYKGGVVAYCNELKINILNVSPDTLAHKGAVSEDTVRQMCRGAIRVTGADCAVATSGIAGPGGATPDKPVGTVWICAQTPSETKTQLLHLDGDREAVMDSAVARALMLLMSIIK